MSPTKIKSERQDTSDMIEAPKMEINDSDEIKLAKTNMPDHFGADS